MTQTCKMFYLKALFISTLLSGCANNTHENDKVFAQRQSLATNLEDKEQYADALIQWKIAKTINPGHKNIDAEITRLTQLISQKTTILVSQAKKLSKTGNLTSLKILCLKILALEPANEFAKQKLLDVELQIGLASAEQKTDKMNENSLLIQSRHQAEKDQANYALQSQKLLQQQNFPALLQLSQNYLQNDTDHLLAQQHQYQALINIAEVYQKRGDIEQAIPYLEQADKLQPASGVSEQLNKLKQLLSKNYFKQANKVLKTDIDLAVQYLQSSVTFDPNNLNAYKLLIQANRIQQNLRQIQATN